ncbi:MAG: ATP-dependent Clp protease ATP-binding subunit, partial [Clostridia bacterium]|nr:ATP-dependent Clp protease ATP-binding subunit [Clostridia bacterium]
KVVVFEPLGKEELKKITHIMLSDIEKNLRDKKLYVSFTDALVEYLIENGFDEKFGARPLRRLIEREVEDKIADLFISGELLSGETFTADYQNGEVTIVK